jgi:3D (Asp-Asp-Asp) domain-containing protein
MKRTFLQINKYDWKSCLDILYAIEGEKINIYYLYWILIITNSKKTFAY